MGFHGSLGCSLKSLCGMDFGGIVVKHKLINTLMLICSYMDNKQNTPNQYQETINAAPALSPTKSRHRISSIIVFVLGMLTFGIIVFLYNSYFTPQYEPTQKLATQQAQPVVEKESAITDEDLAKFVDPLDCTKEPAYANMKMSRTLSAIISIDLYDGMLLQGGGVGGAVKWKTLPAVLDYKCKEIKITDLDIGDRVNTYVRSTATPAESSTDVKVIQKANK